MKSRTKGAGGCLWAYHLGWEEEKEEKAEEEEEDEEECYCWWSGPMQYLLAFEMVVVRKAVQGDGALLSTIQEMR